MEIRLKMLTPLWTAGMNGRMDRIHVSGILGSLRWWFEALIRGLGRRSCKPIENAKCSLSGTALRRFQQATRDGRDWWEALDESEKGADSGTLCDVCKVFGTTGWRRRFRMDLEDHTSPIWSPPSRQLTIRPPDRTRGWPLTPGRMGEFSVRIHGEQRIVSLVALLFLFLERWGSIGARPQLGYGFFRITNRGDVSDAARQARWILEIPQGRSPQRNRKGPPLPDLRRFGFFRYDFTPSRPGWWTQVPGIQRVALEVQQLVSAHGVAPIAPALRNQWRFRSWNRRWGDSRLVFGALKPQRRRSRVAVSWAFNPGAAGESRWRVRGWAWLPERGRIHWEELWRILLDRKLWQQVIGVEGQLHSMPASPSWQPHTREQVVQLIEGVIS